MGMAAHIQASDRVMEKLVAGLEFEFGRGAGQALAPRFLIVEEADFLWDARIEERWMSAYESVDDGCLDLDRVVIVGRLGGRWFVAQMIVDGEGCAQGVLGRRDFRSQKAARKAFTDA